MTGALVRTALLLASLALSACGAVGQIDTGAMQTTNHVLGEPTTGPGNPPSPPPATPH